MVNRDGKNGSGRSSGSSSERGASSAPREIVYVVGGARRRDAEGRELRDFPLIAPKTDEPTPTHVARVARRIDAAIAAGGTHLLIPYQAADWLDEHPALADYLIDRHELAHANPATGITFAFRRPHPIALTFEVEGWQIDQGEALRLVAPRRLVSPRVMLRPVIPARGLLTGSLTLRPKDLRTLRLAFALTRPDRRRPHVREIFLSLARPGFLTHDLPFVAVTFAGDGTVRVDFDLKLDRGRALERIAIELVEEDNWRMHPNYPGGDSFALPAVAPAGARLDVREVSLRETPTLRKGPPHGTVHAPRPEPYRRPAGARRDAVIFSSWVPEEGLTLGDAYIAILQRWHAESKIFVGVNHGSSPRWVERLLASGLDVTVQPALSTMTMPYDPTGFVAALDAYRRYPERFDLVWFGHNKGGDHLDEVWYATSRWTIERMFWSRRAEIAAYFADPVIGLYTPHYLMMLQEHLAQTDALERMYRATCRPLGAMAVSAHFVMREESVRAFCEEVDPRFFIAGVEPFGGDRYFFEMAMPNVPIMQGYEPYIEPGLGGTSGAPKMNGVASILNDWRQNNAVTALELEKWRQRPTRFRTQHREHNRVD